MGLLDTLTAQTPQGEQIRSGLLGLGMGLLGGSTGHYGQFAPALAMGLGGMQRGMQDTRENQMREQQLAQDAMWNNLRTQQAQLDLSNQQGLRDWLAPTSTGTAQAFPVGAGGAGTTASMLQQRVQEALASPNPEIRQWGFKMASMQNSNTQGMSGLVPTDRGYAYRKPDGSTGFLVGDDGKPLMPVSLLAQDPSRQQDIAQSKAYGAETGKSQAGLEFNAPGAIEDADRMLSTIDEVMSHPGLNQAVGAYVGALPTITPDARDFGAKLGQLQGQVFLQAYEKLKGAGVITDFEGQKAEAALAALTRAQSSEQFKAALQDLRAVVSSGQDRLRSRVGGANGAGQPAPAAQAAPAAPQSNQGGFSHLWGG